MPSETPHLGLPLTWNNGTRCDSSRYYAVNETIRWLYMQTLSWWNLPHSPGEPHMGQNALSCLGQLANPDTGVIFARIQFACTALCERKSPHGELSLRWACYI